VRGAGFEKEKKKKRGEHLLRKRTSLVRGERMMIPRTLEGQSSGTKQPENLSGGRKLIGFEWRRSGELQGNNKESKRKKGGPAKNGKGKRGQRKKRMRGDAGGFQALVSKLSLVLMVGEVVAGEGDKRNGGKLKKPVGQCKEGEGDGKVPGQESAPKTGINLFTSLGRVEIQRRRRVGPKRGKQRGLVIKKRCAW